MIKAIFFDLDGTLLTTEKVISKNSIAALKICRDKGIKIHVATARPPTLSKALGFNEREMEFVREGIYYDGSCIIHNNIKKYMTLDNDIVLEAIKVISKYDDINIAVQMEDEKHSHRYEMDSITYSLWGVTDSDLYPFVKLKDCEYDFIKVLAFSKKDIGFLKKELHLVFGDRINIYFDSYVNMLQINNIMTNKKTGILEMIKAASIKSNEVAVFGDSDNDLEMLKHFRYSVAMGNSIYEIQNAARYTTLSNDQEGIYYALKNLLYLI